MYLPQIQRRVFECLHESNDKQAIEQLKLVNASMKVAAQDAALYNMPPNSATLGFYKCSIHSELHHFVWFYPKTFMAVDYLCKSPDEPFFCLWDIERIKELIASQHPGSLGVGQYHFDSKGALTTDLTFTKALNLRTKYAVGNNARELVSEKSGWLYRFQAMRSK